MAKRKAFLHVGLPHSGGDLLTLALGRHLDTLLTQGVRTPARSADELFRAVVEIRRDHRAWGMRRKDVEGAWSRICRRAFEGRDTVVFSHDLLAGATPAEIDLLVDQLRGFAVHVIVTATEPDPRVSLFPDDHDLGDVLRRWSQAVRSPDRVHVVVTDPEDPADAWRAWGRIIGFDADALDLPDRDELAGLGDTTTLRVIAESAATLASHDELVELVEDWGKAIAEAGYDVHGDVGALSPGPRPPSEPNASSGDRRMTVVTEALSEALAEVSRLRDRTHELEQLTERLERKRRKLGKRLAKAG